MAEVDLLRSLPKVKRDVSIRLAERDPRLLALTHEFGELYFDGPREYGYGGYHYDGRWLSVAQDIVRHFNLKPGMRVLDVGCAKGFLVCDLLRVLPGLHVTGIDISRYALANAHPDAKRHVFWGSCTDLAFPDGYFDVVLAINTIHNVARREVVRSLQEIMRVSRDGRAFVQVDSYYTPEQRELFLDWVLTAKFHDYPDGWRRVFEESGYRGDWGWTLVNGTSESWPNLKVVA